MKIFVVNGYPGVGKTTFEHIVQNALGADRVTIWSTIDPIKDIAVELGWDGVKDNRGRQLLSNLKTALNLYNDFTMDKLRRVIFQARDKDMVNFEHILFVDSREPGEIAEIKRRYGAQTILIDREIEQEISNESDRHVEEFFYDFKLKNNKDLTSFGYEIAAFLIQQGFISPDTCYTVDLEGEITTL